MPSAQPFGGGAPNPALKLGREIQRGESGAHGQRPCGEGARPGTEGRAAAMHPGGNQRK